MNPAMSAGGNLEGRTDVSLSEVAAAFLAEKAAELSPYSVTHLRGSLKKLAQGLDDPPVESIRYADLRRFVDGLYLRYKPGTIKPIVGDVRQFFRWAKKRKLVPRNPAKRLRAPSQRAVAATAEEKAAPERDVHQVINYLSSQLGRVVYRDLFGNLVAVRRPTYEELQILRNLFVIVLIYETGARVGEVRALGSRAMDVALQSPGPAFPLIVNGKTGQRLMWFTVATAELWHLWQRVRPRGCDEFAVVGWQRHAAPTPINGRSTLTRMMTRYCEAAGVEPFGAHALRYAKAQRARRAVGLEVASRLLDHSSTAVTEGYAGVQRHELSEAAVKTGLAYRLWSG